jgi:hypothetical protein
MGDGADIAIEEMLDNEEDLLDYITGQMSDEEAYERGIIDNEETPFDEDNDDG